MIQKRQVYFKVLGISSTTDKSIIKKAYRKKAFQYHPDRNKLPSAHEKFIQLTEAYEVLMGEQKLNKRSPFSKRKTAEELLVERMRSARERYRKTQERTVREEAVYFEKITTGARGGAFRVFGLLALAVAVVWFLDYHVLESNTETIIVEPTSSQGDRVCYFIKGRDYCFSKHEISVFSKLSTRACFSPIYNDLKYIEYERRGEIRTVVPFGGFARAYPYFILFLLLPFFTFTFRKSTITFTVLYLFSSSVVAFLLLFRLVSLGF